MKAIIPVAGLGTRMLPATKAIPKEMLTIVDKPLIQYVVSECVNAGIKEIVLVTHSSKNSIENHFDTSYELESMLEKRVKRQLLEEVRSIIPQGVTIMHVRQGNAKGLGHAVLCAKHFVGDEPFAVLLGDDIMDAEVPVLKQLMDVYEDCEGSVLGVQEVPKDRVSSYGVVKPVAVKERLWRADDLVEKPSVEEAPSRLAVLGRYIISPEIFGILEKTEPGRGGEIQLTDALKKLSEREPVYAYEFEGRRYDVGDKQGYLEATVDFALKRPDLREPFLRYLLKTVGKETGL